MKKNKSVYLLFTLLLIGGCILYWNLSSKKKLDTSPIPDSILLQNDKNSFYIIKKINEETEYAKIDIEYPVFKGVEDSFNATIFSDINAAIQEHKQFSEENWKARFETQLPGDSIPAQPSPDQKFTLQISFKQSEANQDHISGLLEYNGYTGGAHGYQNFVAYNYDLKNKKEITFSEYLKSIGKTFPDIQKYVREQLIAKYAASTDQDQKEYNEIAKQTIIDGTSNESDFKIFTFTKNGGKVYFGQYQVGPYAIGIPEVEI